MRKLFGILFFLIPVTALMAQTDTTGKVKYTSDYVFDEGIYLTFDQFKADSPAVREFFVKKPAPYSDPNYTLIEYVCKDSVKTPGNCVLSECWGYSYRGDVYIAHEYYAYYFKLMVIGSVCHFVGLSGIGATGNDIMTGFGGDNEYKQFFLDFETGDVQLFNYKYFSEFLKSHDDALYQELLKQKKKKKLIFKYLLKYNEKHPIYFG
jgi:hypothetical protein